MIHLIQHIAYLILRVSLVIAYKHKVKNRVILSFKQIILVSNHASMLDAFIETSSQPYDQFKHFSPYGFIAHNAYLDKWWKRMFLLPLGLYPAKSMGKIKGGLEKSQELIDKGYSLLFFPEGTRTEKGKARPRKGVVVLATKNKMPILPVHIEWKKVGKHRKKADISFGGPYCLLPNRDFDELAYFVVDHIYSL